MKPFNLEEALKNPERVFYRDGVKPEDWYFSEKTGVVVSITKGNALAHHKNGAFNINRISDSDLFIKEEKINVAVAFDASILSNSRDYFPKSSYVYIMPSDHIEEYRKLGCIVKEFEINKP